MAYLNFNKAELVNLEYSLKREVISTNRAGGYLNTTIVGCNTRKYHGLFAVPIAAFGGHRHILLSSVDETLLQHDKPFNLGIHCYGDIYEPRGHKYIVNFEMDPVPAVTYRVGGMMLRKELFFAGKKEQLLVRYTMLEDSSTHTVLRLKPFLPFRSIHSLTKANVEADTRFDSVPCGAAYCLYKGFPKLYIQFSKENEYVHCPDWYRNIVYTEEYRRGFDCCEDLMVPGFFDIPIRKGESIVMSVSTSSADPALLKSQFSRQMAAIEPRRGYEDCLRAAAGQLISYNENGSICVCTGFSWHEIGGLRETCIALPGLTIYNNADKGLFCRILDDLLKDQAVALYETSNQVEAPLRLAELLQHLARFTGNAREVWKKYGKVLKRVVASYIYGRPEVRLCENGLLWAEKDGVALSWMNAYVDGRPVTERRGWQVETNSLWYNALCFVADMEAAFGKEKTFAERCREISKAVERCFLDIFWVEARHHLADYVDENGQNVFTRPNQLYACSLDYSPIPETYRHEVLRAVRRELCTTRGIRTLSPKNPRYKSRYEGNQIQRDTATHNGCNRPWLLGAYADASFRLYGPAFSREARELTDGFQEDMNVHGLGSVAEIYDGDPPYIPHGAITSAVSVAEILRVKYLIGKYGEEEL